MRVTRLAALALALLAGVSALTACSSSSSGGGGGGGGGSDKNVTLSYWASNQGTSLDNDKQVLGPELAKFTQQTGIKVKLRGRALVRPAQQHPDRDHLGQGPRRAQHRQHLVGVAAGHRRVRAVRRPDHGRKIGGKDRFLGRSLSATGAAGKPRRLCRSTASPTACTTTRSVRPGRHHQPPTTWDQLVEDGKKLTKRQHWGLSIEGANVGERPPRVHLQPAARRRFFDAAGKPTFDTPQNVAGDQAVHRLHGRRQDHQSEQRGVRAEPVAFRLRQGQVGHAAVAVRAGSLKQQA